MAISEGLEAALAAIAAIEPRLAAIEAKLDALSNEWLDAEATGAYLSRSTSAVERAWRRGSIPSVVSPDGRRRSTKAMLDRYMLGNGKP